MATAAATAPPDPSAANPPDSGGTLDPMAVFKRMRQDRAAPKAVATQPAAPPAPDAPTTDEGPDSHLRAAQAAMAKMLEPEPQTQPTPPAQQWSSMAMAVAALGGLLTHTPATTSMNAMAGVLKAYKEGDTARAQQEYEKWKTAHDALGKSVDLELKSYEAALKETDPRRRLAALQAQTAAFKIDAIQRHLDAGDMIGAENLIGGMRKAASGLSAAGEKLADARAAITYDDAQHPDIDPKERALRHSALLAGKDPDEGKGASANWTMATDPKTQEQYLYKVDKDGNVQAKTLNGQEYKPSGVAHVGQAKAPQVSGLSGAALEKAARYYHTTHQLPPGFGAAADKEAIQNREAELYPDDTSAPERQASYKADTQSLGMLTKQTDAINAYDKAATKELELAVSLLPKTPEPVDSQLLTRWVRTGETQFGDVAVPKYMAALISGLDEYAKVLSGSYGAAGSTDSSRAQAASLIPEGATTDQVRGIVPVLKQGMEFKRLSYEGQIDAIKGRLGGQSSAPSASTTSLPPAAVSQLKEGHVTTFANGQKWTLTDGQPAQVQ